MGKLAGLLCAPCMLDAWFGLATEQCWACLRRKGGTSQLACYANYACLDAYSRHSYLGLHWTGYCERWNSYIAIAGCDSRLSGTGYCERWNSYIAIAGCDSRLSGTAVSFY